MKSFNSLIIMRKIFCRKLYVLFNFDGKSLYPKISEESLELYFYLGLNTKQYLKELTFCSK